MGSSVKLQIKTVPDEFNTTTLLLHRSITLPAFERPQDNLNRTLALPGRNQIWLVCRKKTLPSKKKRDVPGEILFYQPRSLSKIHSIRFKPATRKTVRNKKSNGISEFYTKSESV